MSLDIENFEEVKLKGESLYKSIGVIRCPYLKNEVHFNFQGLEHLKFKRRNKARPQQDQYMRFKLLYLAPEVIKNSHTLQGIWNTKHFEKVRVHNRTDAVMRDITYYEFVAVVEKVRVKVIVKKIIEENTCYFWSIIPYWGVDKNTSTKKLHSGYPEED
jgi:hypothetical protein